MPRQQMLTNSVNAGWRRRFWPFLKYATLLCGLAVVAVGVAARGPKYYRKLASKRHAARLEALIADELQAIRQSSYREPVVADDELPRPVSTINRLLPDVPFVDLVGRNGSLREYRGRILVISMTSIGCPICKKLVPALSRVAEEHGDDQVQFLLLNVERDSSPEELAAHAKEFPGWRYVRDPDARLARALAARTTSETFVIDQAQTLRYRGAVDDRFDVGVSRPEAQAEYLRVAIRAVSQDRPVGLPVTEAPGCLLGLAPAEKVTEPITWHHQIARLARHNCVECHRPGEAAPFSLETYQQVVDKKSMIEHVLAERIMPPWFADHRFGEWRNDRYISDADLELFRQWVREGCVEGDPADSPVPVTQASGWTISKPDAVIDVEPQKVPAEGVLEWVKIPVDYAVPTDLWVAEAEIRPSVPEVVHHAMLFVEYAKDDPRGAAQTEGESADGGGGNGFWLSYFPGRKALILPPGRGKLIPRGGKIFIQMHYTPYGEEVVDRPQIGLKFLPGLPEKSVVSGAVNGNSMISIQANSRAEYVAAETVDEDINLVSVMPHMHIRGSAAQLFIRYPDGRIKTLLHVPKYDFNWQVSYEFPKPLLVTRGSQLIIRHEYDNRVENPRNPDPKQVVRGGGLTTDEMMCNFFDWEPAGEEPPPGKTRRPFTP